MIKKKKAIIVGSGISGIAAAIRLNKKGYETHVYEANSYPGGKIREMNKNSMKYIDLVVVNFYPFQETIQKTNNFQTIIENIDIGGPTLVRAAAKMVIDLIWGHLYLLNLIY